MLYARKLRNTQEILSAIDGELARLRQVRDLLAGQAGSNQLRSPVRPKGSVNKPKADTPKRKGGMSPEGRQRVAAAQRARWAAAKKAGKAPSKSAPAKALAAKV